MTHPPGTDAQLSAILSLPALYIQGPGAISRLGECVMSLGRHALFVSDRDVGKRFAAQAAASVEASGVSFHAALFDGDVTRNTVAMLLADARALQPAIDVVIAAGGGKGIDAGKAVASALGVALVTLPTAASNDGPGSRVFLFYDEQHRLESVERLPRNPDAVVVDTSILAAAPVSFLIAGIGDAIAKRWEAEQCIGADRPNLLGGRATLTALSLARASDQTLRVHGVAALRAARSGRPDASFEAVIEASILMAGIGFEGCGLSVAHSMTRGLTALPPTAAAAHGVQIAYALLVQFLLEERDAPFMRAQFDFHASIGLPTRLAGLGLPNPSAADLSTIARLTCQAPHIANFSRPLSEADLVDAMRRLESMH